MKQYLNIFFVVFLYLLVFCSTCFAAEKKSPQDKGNSSSIKERFIPVELFTGTKWDGMHELKLKEVSTALTYLIESITKSNTAFPDDL